MGMGLGIIISETQYNWILWVWSSFTTTQFFSDVNVYGLKLFFNSNYRKTPLLVPATNTAFYFFLQCLLRVLLTFWDFFFQKLKPDFMHLVPVFKVNLSFF